MKWALLLVVAVLAVIPLASQSPLELLVPEPGDPTSRVARLNWLAGDVVFQPAGLDEWTSATLNYPLTASDHLYTPKDARAELHIGQNVIRLDSNSNFGFINLDDSIVQVSLTEGAIQIDLFQLPENDTFEIGTPYGAITLLQPGDYRIDTNVERETTTLRVRSGQAELPWGLNSIIIRAQETAFFQTDQRPEIRPANAADAFDAFVENRIDLAQPPARSERVSDRYGDDSPTVPEMISAGMTGAEDLAVYGSWQTIPRYGQAWAPPVDPKWVPYSDGNWAFIEPWGWTWVDAAPWGFAPFHYGRWVYASYRWFWVPGPRRTVQYYAPALVTFMGGGPADRVSWIALSPRDPWIPPWRTTVDLQGRRWEPRNRQAPGAVVSMSPREFVSGARARPQTGITPDGVVLGSSPNVMPTTESLLMRPSRLRPMVSNRPLILRTAPPLPPIGFFAKTTLLAMAPGRPLTSAQLEMLRRQSPRAAMQRPPVRFTRPLPVRSPAPVKPAGSARAPQGGGRARR